MLIKNKPSQRNLKAEAATATLKKPSALTKKEKRIIADRIAEIKSAKKSRKSTQNTIGYIQMFKDGICHVEQNIYSMTIQFYNTNYRLADFDEKTNIFEGFRELINSFDNTVKFQLTYENQDRNISDMLKEIIIPEQNDVFNDIRSEYSDMLASKIKSGKNNQEILKFLTFSVEAHSHKAAKVRMDGIQKEIIKNFRSIGVEACVLNGEERLKTLYYSLNPMINQDFIFDWNYMLAAGMDTKDYISPSSIKFNKNNFELANAWGSVSNINILASELPDDILRGLFENNNLNCVNIHVEPLDQIEALKFIKLKLTAVEAMKVDEQKKASTGGWDMDILPPSLKMYIEELENLLEDLNNKNERLFHISLSIRQYANSKKNLKLQAEYVKRLCQKNNCILIPYDYTQEDALNSSLPLGLNKIQITREMHTSGIAIFMPFTTQELFQPDGTYYGVNSISGGLIMASRKMLKNPNGLILGTPGAGKSFAVKREILDSFLKTTDDIIICDPEGEYFPLVLKLHGQVIKISASSKQHINPMDIAIDISIIDELISVKSDFIISFCEIIIGSIRSDERSAIDKCVDRIYRRFFNNNPSKENMPVLADLLKELKQMGDVAERVYNSLEMYVSGSQNIFSYRTNVDIENRIVCFDIKELGNQLKKVAMLVMQDAVWNRVSMNRSLKKSTRYYMDEFHLLLKDEQTAKYSAEIWKRFRKWGGIPTGITQNVKDLLSSPEIENIFDNSDFVYMLNQASGDREILAEKFHISTEQLQYITNSEQGCGLIRFDKTILPFNDQFPTDSMMYKLMSTKPNEQM
ncbi:MAG: DUF87 domain-containing protein [Oscillospiraceae bacterium]|nr:DUF87 domain-containing protein [Oscillospiraceae bacterium]